MVLQGVPTGIEIAASGNIPFLSSNVYGVLTLVTVFGAFTCLLTGLYGTRLYQKTGQLGDFAVWKE